MRGPLWSLPAPSAILPELLLHGGKEGGLHHGRGGDRDPVLSRTWLHAGSLTRMFGPRLGRARSQPPPRNAASTAVRCRTLVGGVLQHLADRPAVPAAGRRARGHAIRPPTAPHHPPR